MEDIAENNRQQTRQKTHLVNKNIIYRSETMALLMESVIKVAKKDTNVLITGETGTGKEVIAHEIHNLSSRRNKAFVAINCSAIPVNLLESEMFGHEKGAFSGAIRQKTGKFELANGGTILLDEIGELPKDMQTKLLRVIQEKKFERVGGEETISVDVRILSATNRDLLEQIAYNNFREDLYHRICVYPLHIPPLRERKEDVQLLIEYFREKLISQKGFSITKIDKRVVNALIRYDWPGNVRQMENVIERMMVDTTNGTINLNHLPQEILSFSQSETPDIIDFERENINGYVKLYDYIQTSANPTLQQITIYAKQFGIWPSERGIVGLGRQIIKLFERNETFAQIFDQESARKYFDTLCLNKSFEKEQSKNIERIVDSLPHKRDNYQDVKSNDEPHQNSNSHQQEPKQEYDIPIKVLRSLFVPTLAYDLAKGFMRWIEKTGEMVRQDVDLKGEKMRC